ncbi:MAG: hypothetical protein ACN4GM_12160 [Gammaproteobacteria bacterium]
MNQLEGAEHASTANAPLHNDTHNSSSHFDDRMDELLNIAETLVLSKGVFHLTLHFSSSQIKCCTFDNPYSFQLYTADEVFSEDFMRHFAPLESKLSTRIERNQVRPILNALKWLRSKKHGSELRNASLHMINGYIGLSFAYDDTRYINFRELILPTMTTNA